MFRPITDAVARVFASRPQVRETDLAREVRTPDPYVWRLPSPYEARWRRWFKRSREAGRYLPVPRDEGGRRLPSDAVQPSWQTEDDVVRPYVLRP
ncbi:hypothetical protein ACGFT2_10875 [Streptomyces sp. NPDC048514]|uniref:hypothetical protein n=1 Tax=Streptomyces sp. NPDC048514 TaxID=3365564 RepID=UPI0037231D54